VHRAEHAVDRGKLLLVKVGRHDAGTAPVGLEGVPPGAAAKVEHPVAGIDWKFREIDG
jgi:hypothetical protein